MNFDWKKISRDQIIGDRSQGENFDLLHKMIHVNNLNLVIFGMKEALNKFIENNPEKDISLSKEKIDILEEVQWWITGLHYQKEISEKLSYRDHMCNLALENKVQELEKEIVLLKNKIKF